MVSFFALVESLTCFIAFFVCKYSNGSPCVAGVTNAQFVCGKAEDIIVDVFKNMPRKTKIIGIMDPPRAGLRKYKQHVLHYYSFSFTS